MAESIGSAVFTLRADVGPLRAGLREGERLSASSVSRMEQGIGRSMGRISRGMGSTGRSMTHMFTLPILGIAGAAAKMGADFERSMELIHTQAGASQGEVNKLKGAVLDLAKSVPYGPKPLADALYHLESIGLRVSSQMERFGMHISRPIPVMKALKVAAEGAAVGNANLEETATALGSAFLVGIKGAGDLNHTMGALNAAVGIGNMRMGDLVTSLGTGVLPMAKLAGLSLQDVLAALALMSDEGYKSYSAATQLATALHYLYDPTKKASDALDGIGIKQMQMAQDMHKPQGLLVALRDLKDHLDKLPGGIHGVQAEKVLGDIFPAGRGRVLNVLMNQLDRYSGKLDVLSKKQGQFGSDVRATMDQPMVRAQQAIAALQASFVKFGEAVLPTVMDVGLKAVGIVQKVVDAFTKLPKSVQHSIETGGLIVAGIGPALRILGFFTGALSKLSGIATIAARLAAGQGWKAATGGGGGVGAVMGREAASVAEMTVGTMVVENLAGGPGGNGKVAAAEEGAAAAGGGRLSRIGGVLRGVGTRAIGAAAFAGLGYMLTQTVAMGFHGGAKKWVTDVGTGASIGGGLGSLFGPAGTFAGAVAGAMAGGVAKYLQDDATKQGRDFANTVAGQAVPRQVSARRAKQAAESFQKAYDEAQQAVAAAHAPAVQTRDGIRMRGRGPNIAGSMFEHQLEHARALRKAYFNEGWAGAQEYISGWEHVRYPSAPKLLQGMFLTLGKMHKGARVEGAKAMLTWAAGMEAQRKLPEGTVNKMIIAIHKRFPGLYTFLRQAGYTSDRSLAAGLKLTQSTKNLKEALNRERDEFGSFPKDVKITGDNVNKYAGVAMRDLKWQMAHGTRDARMAAKAEFDHLQDLVNHSFDAMTKKVTTSMKDLTQPIQSNLSWAVKAAGRNMADFEKSIYSAMNSGILSSTDGAKKISAALNAELKAFGAKPIPIAELKATETKHTPVFIGGKGTAGGTFQRGGLFTVGERGDRGLDNIPLNVGGKPIMVGSGEQVAVFNAQQQAVMDASLANYGGLAGLFGSFRAEHRTIPRFAKGGPVGSLQAMMARANAIDRMHYAYSWGGGHNPSFSGPYDCSGAVSAVLHAGGVLRAPEVSGQFMGYGLPGPGVVTLYANPEHVYMALGGHFFGTSNANPGGGAGWFPGAPRPGFVVRHVPAGNTKIPIPRIVGDGTVPTLARQAVNKEGRAAQRKLNEVMNRMFAGGGFGGGDAGEFGGGSVGYNAIANLWIQAGGPPDLARTMAAIAMAESGGRNVIQSGQPYATTGWGLWQITPGNSEPQFGTNQALLQPLNNARAAVAKYRAGGLSQWTTYTSGRYRQFLQGGTLQSAPNTGPGGFFQTGGRSGKKTVKHAPKHAATSAPGTKLLQTFSQLSGKVGELEKQQSHYATIYDALSGRFAVDEQFAQYLNPDGSLNAAGIAKKTADDERLLDIANALYMIDVAEKDPVSQALHHFLKRKSTVQKYIDRDTAILKRNSLKEGSLRLARTLLAKPWKDEVGGIESAIHRVHDKWDPVIKAALKRKQSYHGKNKATKENLANAVNAARWSEQAALQPLTRALHIAQDDSRRHSDSVRGKRWNIAVELQKLINEDKVIRSKRTDLNDLLTGGDNSSGGISDKINALTQAAERLGTPLYDKHGRFVRIDTRNQGAAFEQMTQIHQLQQTVAADKGLAVAPIEDPSVMAGYYQQIAEQATRRYAISEIELAALRGMPAFGSYRMPSFYTYQMPPYAGAFATGGVVPGPMGMPQTAIVHGGERITPPDVNSNVKVILEDNRTRVLVDDVEQAMTVVNRKSVRAIGRRLPGVGGGTR